MEASITISMKKGEQLPCPGCGKIHKINIKEISLSLGTCEACESEILVDLDTIETGAVQ